MSNYNTLPASYQQLASPLGSPLEAIAHNLTCAYLRTPAHTFRLTVGNAVTNLAPLLQIQEPGLRPRKQKADAAHDAAFLRPTHGNTLYGRAVRAALRLAGSFCPVVSTRTVPPTLIETRARNIYRTKGVIAMTNPARIPSPNRAARYRALALSALHADSSLAVRLKRYNANMAKARALEAANPAQPVPLAPCPADSGNPAHIQIVQRGNFWHILQGGITRAFAPSYRAAQVRALQLQGGAL